MSDADTPFDDGGAWIFLSHSHRDFDKVRVVRNALEERGHRPLMFFLKCMDDDAEGLPDLIRREIEARTWFLLCDSPNAQASSWVQAEVEIIKSLDGKVHETVDLDSPLEEQIDRIEALSRRASVYVSTFGFAESDLSALIATELRASGFSVLTPDELLEGSPGVSGDDLDACLDRAFVVPVITSATLKSPIATGDVKAAIHRDPNRVLPVVVGKVTDDDLEDLLGDGVFRARVGLVGLERSIDVLTAELRRRALIQP